MKMHSARPPESDRQQITEICEQYFSGLHHGDVEALEAIFHEECRLQAPGLRLTRNAWLDRVRERVSPAQRGDAYAYRILEIDISGLEAMTKIECPLLGHHYIDFLGLLKENGQWKIVNKMYADSKKE